ncbi:kinesin-like protein KIF20B isoform X3 [Hyla sarda]|uniref:kinesin-like protein KIF20B isoform X3 n=1 Tax=Hyla sarda TaxID=327740 RepID=UPI0024C21606|nr:kinesin-like protein KIF20B isoform X3 [Hyla sarda]
MCSVRMKPSEENRPAPRPSYLGEGITYPERDGPQEIDDIRTNLSERFLLLEDTESDSVLKSSLDAKEPMQVFLRVRPFTGSEIEQKESQDCVSIPDPCSVLVKAPLSSQAIRLSDRGGGSMAQKFSFTQVFGPETTQSQFFEGTIKKQVTDFMKGQNRLIFTYGVTNAGKTFTFQGTRDDAGVLPRSMEMLFNAIEGKVYSKMDIKPHRCKDYIRLTKEQVRTENAFKNGVLRHSKEVDLHCSVRSNNSRTSADTTDILNEDAGVSSNCSRVLSEFEESVRESERFKLEVDDNIKFSVWISFCEIYNECIYDLLDPVSGDKCYKRKTLKLAQDVKGFSFVKDLQWIQVSDAKEACRILALGKRFQSIAFTKLNSSSSRSHSIFTVRLLKIEDTDVPRVVKVSELTLCDLAGSERCTKTHNEGERLKESGNINTSLLILGKCINALKNSQQSKIQQHVPFRESKLTHYLQSFFSGKGKVCMIVNISQAASAYDETLNVLKFSAVAQKVLILDACQAVNSLTQVQRKSAREVSFIINNADNKRWLTRKRATVQWESRLDDVVEDGDDEEYGENSDDEDPFDCTNLDDPDDDAEEDEDDIVIKKEAYEKLLELVEELKTKLVNEKKEKLLMELKIREEVAKEFTEHFMQRENDFSERLQKEKELLEERCDERMEIFQDLVRKCSNEEEDVEKESTKVPCKSTETTIQADELSLPLQGLFSSMQSDLAVIKKQAVEAHHQIVAIHDDPETIAALEQKLLQVTSNLSETQAELKQKSADLASQINQCTKIRLQLEESDKTLLSQKQQIDQLMDMIHQKDSAMEKLKDLISHWEAKCEDYEKSLNTIRGGMISSSTSRKRLPDDHPSNEEQPPSKKDFVDPNDSHVKSSEKHKDALQDRDESAILRELKDFKVENENYKIQTVKLTQSIVELEGKLAGYEEKFMDLESKNKSIVSELQIQKDLTLSMEGTINTLKQEVDQNQTNIANKVAQIKTIQSKLDDFGNADPSQEYFNITDLMEESTKKNLGQIESQVGQMASGRESAFYNAIEGLWRKCQDVLQESSKKNKQLLHLEKQLNDLKNEMAILQNIKESEMSSQVSHFKEKDELIVQLRKQLLETTKHLESLKNQEIDYKNQLLSSSQQIKDLKLLTDSYKEKSERLSRLEEESKEKSAAVETLEKRLAELQAEHMGCEKSQKKLNDEKTELEQKIKAAQEELQAAETTKNEREKQVKESVEDIKLFKKELLQKDDILKTVQLDLQRKEEDYTELKDKLADAKKQMQQVEKEISAMRDEKKTLTNKMNEYEKLKKQMSCELEVKQRTIQQLSKEQCNNERTENTLQLYQKACEDVKAKEKVIEDMKLTLNEQEETQEELEQALEAKTEEAEKFAEELELWKQKYREKISGKENVIELSRETNNNTETVKSEVSKLQNQLKELEEKFNNDRKKWFEEKKTLIAQAKESENQRNREMRKFADDRERYGKQQIAMEQLSAQLAEKDNTLQKWREERDSLLSALEAQLKNLLTSNADKEKEIELLKSTNRESLPLPDSSAVEGLKRQLAASEAKVKEYQEKVAQLEHSQSSAITAKEKEEVGIAKTMMKTQEDCTMLCKDKKSSTCVTDDSASDVQSQDGSDVVLDSSMISTENGRTSRFPKPQMEIRFSPVKPNKMEVKHHGNDSPITVKISRPTRKRKSTDMEQDVVKSENRKNTRTNKMTPSSLASPTTSIFGSKKLTLTKQPSSSSTASTQKKDGTLQKLGEFLHSSPTIFHTKAKKFLETIGAPKNTAVNSGRNADENKPKKSRRKLYTTEISAPLDIPAHAIILDTNERESDHLIMKRRLRTRTAK